MDKPTRKRSSNGAKKPMQNRGFKNVGFAAVVILIILVIAAAYGQTSNLKEIPLTQAISAANRGDYERLNVNGNEIDITPKGASIPTMKAYGDPNASLKDEGLNYNKVQVSYKAASNGQSLWVTLGSPILSIIVISAVLYFILRSAQGQGNQAMSFGKSRARLYGNEKNKVVFNDVAGSGEAKQDLQEVVEFLKYPKKFAAVGARIPKGVLLVGPPGTGKTLLARAVAGEANVPFFSISGSEFVEMFVGVGASRVRDLFAKAKKNAPCIIFVDEIDAVGRRRGSGMGGGHDEREQTLNQILVEMDGFEQGQNVIVLAATNRADVLDPALLRPGRFDRRVNIGLPDRKDREAVLKIHFAKKPLDPHVDLDALAAKSAGSSGADLANIANEAAIVAARHNRHEINNADVTEAFERVAIGPERKSKIMTDADKQVTAYHESGHALVGHVLPDSDMVHKVTIIPRGGTGGVTWFIPPEDKVYVSLIEFKDTLARALGGRIAEEVILGHDRITTGAGNDLQKAAEIARDMVVNQGMGNVLRDQVFQTDDGMMIDRLVHDRSYSDETANVIDKEVENLITEAANRARAVIKANLDKLEALKDQLLEKETLDASEVAEIFKGATMPKAAALY
jgi:cell division protease FtsH